MKKTQDSKGQLSDCYRKEFVELFFRVWPDRGM